LAGIEGLVFSLTLAARPRKPEAEDFVSNP
jgi:hypothetical protein